MKRVLLTGAGGFVGHHTLTHVLQTTDWDVVCTDSFRHRGKTDRLREVLSDLPDKERVSVFTHDLTAPISPQLAYEFGQIDYIISMASESHVDRSITDPRPFVENNVALILTLLEYARQYPVEKFLHVSTDEVYGPAPEGHDHVEGEPHRPSNPYSASKSAQEAICHSYWPTYNMPIGVTSTMNIIGERQDPEKFVPHVLVNALNGTPVTIHGSSTGQPGSRFYLHARNQADALRFLLDTQDFPKWRDGAEMERWNILGEREIDNLQMAELVATYAGKRLNYKIVDFHSSRPGHDLRYALDGTKMRSLGWEPPVPLEESLERTVRWTLRNPRWLAP
jgi:dTDP-glucose 4,6-dehydratase